MQLYLMENSEDIINHLAFHLKQNCMEKEVAVVKGSPSKIPVEDGQIHLVVFRKSIFNWRANSTKDFSGNLPSFSARRYGLSWRWFLGWTKWNHIENKLKDYGLMLSEQLNGDVWRHRMDNIRGKIIQAGITSFEMICDDEGLRIIIRRPHEQERVS